MNVRAGGVCDFFYELRQLRYMYSVEQLETLNAINYHDSLMAGWALGIHSISDDFLRPK